MTSKQVQKAYKAANRGPKLSRAEQRRQEKAEQERIRKEFEKEKAAAKARAAREKKKEKEKVEREEKRRRGEPTVRVRPSQDTIAWFVRGNGGRKRDAGGRVLNVVEEEPEPDEVPQASPRKGVDQELDQEADVLERNIDETVDENIRRDTPTKKRKIADPAVETNITERVTARQTPPAPTAWTIDMDDLNDAFYDGMGPAMPERTETLRHYEEREGQEPAKAKPTGPVASAPSPVIPTTELDDLDEFSDDIELDMIENMERLEKAIEIDADKPHAIPIEDPPRGAGLREADLDDFEILEDDFETSGETNPEEKTTSEKANTHRKMLPPPRPKISPPPGTNYLEDFGEDIEVAMQELDALGQKPRKEHERKEEPFKFAIPAIPIPKPIPQRNPILQRHTTRSAHDLGLQRPRPSFHRPPTKPPRPHSPSPPRQAPPLSTQAILFNFDDFFPSPSQQVRELEEERLSQPSPLRPPKLPRQEPEREAEPEPALQPALHSSGPEQEDEQEQDEPVSLHGSEPRSSHESEVEAEPAHEPEPDPESDSTSPSPPKGRFFTSSGSHELMALAIQRSRRTAALEELRKREEARLETGLIEKAEADEKAKRERVQARAKAKAAALSAKKVPEKTPLKKPQQPHNTSITKRNEPPQPRTPPKHTHDTSPNNKENLAPKDPTPSASQETEYGGEWIDEMALELMI